MSLDPLPVLVVYHRTYEDREKYLEIMKIYAAEYPKKCLQWRELEISEQELAEWEDDFKAEVQKYFVATKPIDKPLI